MINKIVRFVLALMMLSCVGNVNVLAEEAETSEAGDETVNEIVSVEDDYDEPLLTSEEDVTVLVSGSCGDSATYSLTSDGVLTVSGTGEMADRSVNLNGYGDSVREIVVSEGISRIGIESFLDLKNVNTIRLPSTLVQVGWSAFDFGYESDLTHFNVYYNGTIENWLALKTGDSGSSPFNRGTSSFYVQGVLLENLVIPDGTTSVSAFVFDGYDGLKSVTIPSSVETIYSLAFNGCTEVENVYYQGSLSDWFSIDLRTDRSNPASYGANLYIDGNLFEVGSSFIFPEGLTSVNAALSGKIGLESVTLPSTLKTIMNNAFKGCSSLSQITIPASVETLGANAFDGCSSLETVTFENGSVLSKIDGYAFQYCTSLKAIDIPLSVTTIEYGAFRGMTGLKTIFIPSTVTSIAQTATSVWGSPFKDCSSDLVIYTDNSSKPEGWGNYWNHYSEEGGTLQVVYGTTREQYDEIVDNLVDTEPENNVTVTLSPEGVLTVSGTGAMDNYSASSHIVDDYYLATSVVIEDGITSIGDYAFYEMGITDISIPSTVKSIGEYAFNKCSNLKSVHYSGNIISWLGLNLANDSANPCRNDASLYLNNTLLTDLVIPDTVTSVGNYAFAGCSSITSIKFGRSVTSVGSWAFSYCPSLTTVAIPLSVTKIGGSAFMGCKSLKKVFVPSTASISTGSPFFMCLSDAVVYTDAASDSPDWNSNWNAYSNSGEKLQVVYNTSFSSFVREGNETDPIPFPDDVVVFASLQPVLSDSIAMHIDAIVDTCYLDGDNTVKLHYVIDNEGENTVVLTPEMVDSSGHYDLVVALDAKHANSTITVWSSFNNETSEAKTVSLAKYTTLVDSSNTKLIELCESLQEYGTYADNYFNQATDVELLNEVSAADIVQYKYSVSNSGSKDVLKLRSASLILDSTTSIRIYFEKNASVDISSYSCEVSDITDPSRISLTDSYLEIRGIKPSELSKVMDISIKDETGNVVIHLTYSPMSYAYSALSSSSTSVNLKNLMQKMVVYGENAAL